MKTFLFQCILLLSVSALLFLPNSKKEVTPVNYPAKLPKQDRIDLAMLHEFEITKDPNIGSVPRERLLEANAIRNARLNSNRNSSAVPGVTWQERGPNNVGGRTRALLFDLNDASNGYKKVWAGGVGGGLWYTSDITAAFPVWNKVNDLMDNLAITSIVQNAINPMEMYVGTGEGWFNLDAIKGLGIFKSINGGLTWTRLTSTASFAYVNDLLIDNNGRLYASVTQHGATAGIQKSINGGTSWTQVLGSPVFGSSGNGADLELASNGDIYASLGTIYSNGGVYLSNFTTHTANTGNAGTWTNITPNTSGTIVTPANFWQRIELAPAPSNANIVYALFQGAGSDNCTSIQQYNKTTNSWSVKTVPTIIDQGSNSNFTRGQAWYDLIAAVDPNNSDVLYIGGIDALRSDNGGNTWTQMTTWSLFAATGFTSSQNVHADHHAIVYAPGSSSRAIWGTDGGVDYTANANIAATSKPVFTDKNNGYNVTQYYACAMHPVNANYFLAGAQDNGTQKFTSAGINSTTNASGGDGAFCHIDQDNPAVQITSFLYNNYYVSTDGGASFTSRSFANTGGFINPTDYDNTTNVLYGGNDAGTYFRWNNPAIAGTSTTNVTCSAFGTSTVSHISVSSLTANRVYFGLNNGSVIRVNNANSGTTVTGTVIKNGTGSVSSISIDALNEDHMLVTYSNYGVVSVWESLNATSGSPTWTAVEGNLPDMPVRWVMFDPRNNDWALLATELGVWSTDNLNGAVTDWQPTNTGFANVRVDMLQYRASDNSIAAATHGRGLWTGKLFTTLPIQNITLQGNLETDGKAFLKWVVDSPGPLATYRVQYSTDGIQFYQITELPHDVYQYKHTLNAPIGYYRIVGIEPNQAPVFSNIVTIRANKLNKSLFVKVSPNPANSATTIYITGAGGEYTWQLIRMDGKLVQKGKGNTATNNSISFPLNTSGIASGMYQLKVDAKKQSVTTSFIKL